MLKVGCCVEPVWEGRPHEASFSRLSPVRMRQSTCYKSLALAVAVAQVPQAALALYTLIADPGPARGAQPRSPWGTSLGPPGEWELRHGRMCWAAGQHLLVTVTFSANQQRRQKTTEKSSHRLKKWLLEPVEKLSITFQIFFLPTFLQDLFSKSVKWVVS